VNAVRPAAETPGGESPEEGFPPDRRIRSGAEIRTLLKRGKRRRTPHLDVFFAASPVSHSRFGLIVPKHGQRIVDRNRLRRRLREIGRRELLPRLRERGVAVDLLVRTHRKAYGAEFVTLRGELLELMEERWPAES